MEAEAVYRALLAERPDHPDAIHFLGVLHHQSGRSEEAVELIARAVELRPDHPDIYNNLGNILLQLGRYPEAAQAYRSALALAPGMAMAHQNLAAALRAQGKLELAVASYDRALGLEPDRAETHGNRGNALRQMGRLEEAAVAYERALALDPGHVRSYTNLGQVLYRLERVEQAFEVFRRWAEREPDNPIPRHMMAACSGEDVPGRASDGYVEQVFDHFAESYDENLRALEYRVPAWIASVLPRHLRAERDLEVLDAGCGTGLCAEVLRPYARRLEGIDLSEGMLDRARGVDRYDRLEKAELVAHLSGQDRRWDLIVSADTLVYFGDLEPVMRGARRALRPGGTLVFSVEQLDTAEPGGYRLNAHGRYSHRRDYLERTVAGAGLTLEALEAGVLRNEGGVPVSGWLLVARRPTGSPGPAGTASS